MNWATIKNKISYCRDSARRRRFVLLNSLGVDQECDGQTDGQTDRENRL